MILHLTKILIILIFCSCGGTNKGKIQKTWIGKYEIYHPNSKDERTGELAIRKIIQFDNKNLLIKNFHFHFIDDTNEQFSTSYEYLNNDILTSKDTFNIQNVVEDSLVILTNSGYPRKIVYEELDRYNQANREKELIELLHSNTFTTQEDTIIIEFRKNGKYVSRSFNFGAGSNQFWMTDKFEDELFLVFSGFSGAAIQIQNFNSKQIIGKIYFTETIDVIWNKLEDKTEFEISQIIGEWEQIENPLPPPPIEDEEEYYHKEWLRISNDQILRYEGFRKDTLNWEINRDKNIIIFDNNRHSISRRIGKQWNIISIENDILTLERKIKSFGNFNSNIGMTKFKRKK